MTSRHAFVVAALVTCGVVASAQAPAPKAGPSSEIFLASFEEGARRITRIALLVISRRGVKVGKPVNITKHPGDDNHPSFLPDSSGVVFSSSRDGRPVGTYRYDIATKVTSEFGATIEPLKPAADNNEGRTPAGSRVMGRESRLLIWQESDDDWIPIADFRKTKVGDITRVVVSPDGRWIAFAATPAVK
jgi:WD40 repeat protein